MLDLLTDPNVWMAFATLTVMEIVLGIDNIVFISVLVARLPREQADKARKLGLGLALGFRIALLLVLSWIIALDSDVITLFGNGFSWKDIILIGGGAFLIYKATHEMHTAIEAPDEHGVKAAANATFAVIISQIIVIDMVFSVDSIITAIGMADHVEVMIAAVIVAVGIMFVASGPVAKFVADHPTTKMLALAFLLLIGVSLVADGLGFHIPKGYIYSAMAFSVLVETVNIIAGERRKKKRLSMSAPVAEPVTVSTGSLASDAAAAVAPRPKPKATPARRAQSRPKSAPRRKQ